MISALVNASQSAISKKSHPIASSSIVLAFGTQAEMVASELPNRSFDWTDQSLFIVTAAAYCLLHVKKVKNEYERPKLTK